MADTIEIILSTHAVERFRDRVRPGLAFVEAEEELGRLATTGELSGTPPAWHAPSEDRVAPLYLLIADVALPLRPVGEATYVAVTALTRGSLRINRRRTRPAPRRTASSGRREERRWSRYDARQAAGVIE